MTTFVLIHGAGSGAWYWHAVEAELRSRGHDVVAPDLPCDDDTAGFADYADAVTEAVGDRTDLVVVAQSLGGYTGMLVCDRLPVRLLVLVTAMIPAPGETAGQWWSATGWEQARAEQDERDGRAPDDVVALFLHDVPPDLAAEALARGRDQSAAPFSEAWPLPARPSVPTRFLLCTEDRFFPAPFMRRVVEERLGVRPDEIAAGHCVALSHSKELADRLVRWAGAEDRKGSTG